MSTRTYALTHAHQGCTRGFLVCLYQGGGVVKTNTYPKPPGMYLICDLVVYSCPFLARRYLLACTPRAPSCTRSCFDKTSSSPPPPPPPLLLQGSAQSKRGDSQAGDSGSSAPRRRRRPPPRRWCLGGAVRRLHLQKRRTRRAAALWLLHRGDWYTVARRA
jgi:hypothetical protein